MSAYTITATTTDYATANAWSLFAAASHQDFLTKLIRGIGRGRKALTALSTSALPQGDVKREEQRIPLTAIVGSVSDGRSREFDADFRPLQTRTRDRWISVAEARQRGRQLPPVELVEQSGNYFIVDGHHRISVAAAMGELHIDAVVASAT